MKKYKVSLALKIPTNFEVEIRAKTKKEALEKALKKYHTGKFNENTITELDWNNMELDIDDRAKIDDVGNGIFIEELK
jgi:hypothetical protein